MNIMVKSGNTSKQVVFLSGNEALARGAYEAGIKVAAAYPGTPSSEILEYISQFNEVDSQWSVNEKVAFEVAYGASIAGVRSIYVSKHVGVNVAMDGLMTSAYIGVNAGFVIVTSDDPGLHSSQNEQDNRLVARMANIPLLEPSSPAEAQLFIKQAFVLSERLDVPVMVRLTTRISHTKENVKIGKRVEAPQRKFEINPKKYVMVPGNAFVRHIDLKKRLEKAKGIAGRKTVLLHMRDFVPGDDEMVKRFIGEHIAERYSEDAYLNMHDNWPDGFLLAFDEN